MPSTRMCCTTVVLAAALLSGAGAVAAKTNPLPATPGTSYLALGDSVTFGYMESSVVPVPNYKHAASFHGYPEQLGPQLKLNVTNAACPGETTSSFINTKGISNGCTNVHGKGRGYRAKFPLHVRYKGSQLSFAISFLRSHHNVRLVSLMIGANDAFVCQETTPDHCASPAELNAVVAKVRRNVHTIVSAIRNQAHYAGQLVIVRYYSLDYSSPAVNAESQKLNAAQLEGARPFGIQVADAFSLWRRASQHSGASPCAAGLLTQLRSPGHCGVHPSYAGQALLAQAVARATRLR
jgi:lysophospholipase L1-like esterase